MILTAEYQTERGREVWSGIR